MSVRQEKRTDYPRGKVRLIWMVDIKQKRPDGTKPTRYRAVSPVQTKRGAQQFERQARQAMLDGTFGKKEEVKIEAPTFKKFAEEFQKTYSTPNNKPSTVASKEGEIRRYLMPVFETTRLDQIKMPEIERLKADLLKQGLSPKTIKNVLGTLGKMLSYAQEMGIISEVPRIRHLPVPKSEVVFLKPDELESLLKAAAYNPEWRDMIFFAARTGLRYGELCELRWKDVDLDARTIRVSRSFTRGEVTDRKNRSAYTVPLTLQTVAMLKQRRQLRHLKGTSLVFCKPGGGRHIHRRADVALKRCCRKAGLREIGWHKLRHTFASHLAARGRSIQEIEELLGHKDIQSTMIYAHLMPGQKHDAVAVLDQPSGTLGQHSGNSQEKTV